MKQLNLFNYSSDSIKKQPTLEMSKDNLKNWKNQIEKKGEKVVIKLLGFRFFFLSPFLRKKQIGSELRERDEMSSQDLIEMKRRTRLIK